MRLPSSWRPCLSTVLAVSLAACSEEPVTLGRAVQAERPSTWTLAYTFDFNLDGFQDAIWNDHETNRMAIWLMHGTALLEPGPVTPGPRGEGWIVGTAGDFNLDGMADVHWYNPKTNRMIMWLMRGESIADVGPAIPTPPGEGWLAVSSGDFNLDGIADLLWHNPKTNRMVVSLVRGTGVMDQSPEIPGPPGDGWTAVSAADLNLDGMSDVVWYNPTTNRVAVWLMRGLEIIEKGPEIPGPPGDGWTAVPSIVDYNLDGTGDLTLYNPRTNRMAVWLLRGTALLDPGPEIPGPLGDGWNLAFAGDADGDGMADAFWVNPNLHAMSVWTVRGTHVVTQGPLIPDPSVGR